MTLFFLYLAIQLVMFSPLIDARAGTSLTERVTVKEHKFIPQRPSGRLHVPDLWTLNVANERGKSSVTVTQEFYESTTDGDILTVTGKRGLLSRSWYLKEAHKEA